jgi:ribosomal-protein-alanine N-acetyltransferase
MSDAETLCAIHRACFVEGWSERSFSDLLAAPGTFALQSKDGFILARVAAGEAEILSLGVMPSARRSGQARGLIADAAARAYAQGAATMFLEVGRNNAAARALYDKLDFREVGCRKGYYRISGQAPEDALTLRAELPLTRLGKV